ncbi:MAG: ureidoglycolate lyase [Candidatus Firestonebacteria bacterium]
MKIFSKIKFPTKENFKKYGKIIEGTRKTKGGKGTQYEVLTNSRSEGWLLAYLIVRNRVSKCIEQHPTSRESFEPVKGVCLLIVAPAKFPKKTETFVLDKPIVLHEGIWHDVVALSKEAEVKIAENNSVPTRKIYFKKPVEPVMLVK